MTNWNLIPRAGDGWSMNDPLVSMNSSDYTMNGYYSDTIWNLLLTLATTIFIFNII
jgi:hypothetical protein